MEILLDRIYKKILKIFRKKNNKEKNQKVMTCHKDMKKNLQRKKKEKNL